MRFRLRGNVSVMDWGCISFLAFVTLVVVDGNVAQYTYIDLMGGSRANAYACSNNHLRSNNTMLIVTELWRCWHGLKTMLDARYYFL